MQRLSNNTADNEILDILSHIKEKEDEQQSFFKYDNKVLVLGPTGSGKSTFTQFITGNSDLEVVIEEPIDDKQLGEEVSVEEVSVEEVSAEGGKVEKIEEEVQQQQLQQQENSENKGHLKIIDKDQKISSNVILSHTSFPDLVLDPKTKTAFYDCPGFEDSRGTAHDVASIYFIKKLLDSSKFLKLIFVIPYSSMDGDNRGPFKKFLEHVSLMFNNLNNFSNSIAIIVSRVPSDSKSDLDIKSSIVQFLIKCKKELKELKVKEGESEKMKVNADSLNFINILLKIKREKTSKITLDYPRIGIFRKPNETGLLKDMKSFNDDKEKIQTIISDNIQFSIHNKNDFGYSISSDSQDNLRELVNKINDNIDSEIVTFVQKLQKHYSIEEKSINDLQNVYESFKSGYQYFTKIYEAAFNVEDTFEFKNLIRMYLDKSNITVTTDNLDTITRYDEFLKFINLISNQKYKKVFNLAKEFKEIVEYLKSSLDWYKFLSDLYIRLSKYDIQKNVTHHNDIHDNLKNLILDYNTNKQAENLKKYLDEVIITKYLSYKAYDNIKNVSLNTVKLKFLNEIINLTLNNTLNILSDNNTLVVKGSYIKVSDIINENHSKSIKLFALDTVFIDTDLDKKGDQAQLFIIAPRMEIINDHNIILDGKLIDDSKTACARNGFGYGTKGKIGEPGKPGDSAGHFFAIVNTINGDSLAISANGSKGGRGQCGGNGSDGRNGIDVILPKECSKEMCAKSSCKIFPVGLNGIETKFKAIFNGTRAGNPGDGGDGGKGGFGGNPGKIILIRKNDYSEIKQYNKKGDDGENGKGGSGGKGWPDGNDLKIPFSIINNPIPNGDFIPSCLWRTKDQVIIPGNKRLPGKNGIDGTNVQGIIQPSNITLENPAFIINQYKSYLIENLNNTIQKSFLRSFLNHLEDKKVTDYYDTLGFTNELLMLEKQYLQLRKSISVVPLFESLLKRVQPYALKSIEPEEKIVLNYLNAAILSKLYRIQEYSKKSLVLNLKDDLKNSRHKMEELKGLYNLVQNNKDLTTHKELLFAEIKQAKSLIETDIQPAISDSIQNIDYQIEFLCNKTIALQNAAIKERKKLEEQQEKLKKALALKRILNVVVTTSQFLINFASPMLSVTEAVIKGGLMVSNSEIFSKIGEAGKAVLDVINDGVEQYTAKLKSKADNFLKRLSNAETELNYENNKKFDNVESFKKIFHAINKAKAIFKGKKDPDVDEKSVNEMFQSEYELVTLLQNERNNLEKKKTDSKEPAANEVLDIVKNVQKIFSATKPMIDIVVNDSKEAHTFDDSIQKVDAKLNELLIFEKNIYDIMIPQYTKLQNEVITMQNSLKSKSSVALSISNWKMQSTIESVRNQLQKLVKTFNEIQDFEDLLSKLGKAMDLLTRTYNRIQQLLYQSELAAFVTEINSNQAMEVKLKNPELNKAINQLKFITASNVIIEKYEGAKSAFDIYTFPYGGSYLKMFNQPSLDTSEYENLVINVKKAMLDLESQLIDYETSLSDYKFYIQPKTNFGIDVPPLFEWKNPMIKPLIPKLFRGEIIQLEADITQANIDKSAIKVNELHINFNLVNKKKESELNDLLRKFRVKLIHLGDLYYRCNKEIYNIPSKEIRLSFKLNQKLGNEQGGGDAGYYDLSSSDPVLSPYGTWQIELQPNTTNTTNFDELKRYEHEIMNLELVGKGSFVLNENPFCNDDLKFTYSTYDIPENINSNKNLQEEIQKIGIQNKTYNYNENNSRRRRSVEKANSFHNNEENQFITSGAYSNAQSSFINNIFNSMRKSFIAFENLNPVNLVTQWFNKNENNFDQVLLNNAMEIKLLSYPFLSDELKSSESLNRFINDEKNPKVNHISNSLIYNHGNLLLLDLIIRSKNKSKHNHRNIEINSNSDFTHAQALAYNQYIPL